MTSAARNFVTFGLVFAAAWLSSFAWVRQHGFDDEAFGAVLRVSARAALLVYLVIFVARPLQQLTQSGLAGTLHRNRRLFGVAFAAVMSAHLWYLLWLNGWVFPVPGVVVFSLMYLMLITSFDGPARWLGRKRWRWLHKTGLYVIGLGLAQAEFRRIATGVGEPVHYVFSALILAAIGVRVLAWVRHRPTKKA